ncbi:MFS transporter [Blautia sp. HCP3S3_G3]|uniref:MFS transporter n=1 Tax=Blautia sp. HCP3S3_G3 TaxID=3438913 RepID=UPI003F895571
MNLKLTKKEKSWILYDVGNSAFILLVSTIIPIYFNSLAESGGLSSVEYLAYWGYAASAATLIVALLGPVLGTLADTKGFKKPLFLLSLLVGLIACVSMGLAKQWLAFLVIFLIAKIGYSGSIIFYDSMLSDVTTEDRMDHVSSQGYAWGYIGSCIPFAVCLLLVLGSGSIGISMTVAMALSFVITALWWLGMTVPLLRNYQQKYYVEPQKHAVAESFRRIGRTFKNIRNEKRIFVFLLAFFFYIDGVYTFIDMATAYGSALGLGSTGLLLALLVTQLVAFPCCIIFGRLSAKYPGDILITICIAAYLGITVFAMFLTTQLQFWILAVLVGMFQGGIQALSRSYFTKIIPAEQSGEYFGFLDICGKGASFVGTAIVSIVSQLTGDISKGVGMIALLFLIGIILFRYSVKLNENVLAAADSGKKNF